MSSHFLEDLGQKGLPTAFFPPAFMGVKTPVHTNQVVQLAM